MIDNVIAIDGPAASGKSTIAQKVSETLSIPYISTGNMYRALTWYALQKGLDLNNPDEKAMKNLLATAELEYAKAGDKFEIRLNKQEMGPLIRAPEVTSHVSNLAAMPCVREWMLDKQRSLAKLGLIVMEGRDIGTVIFPGSKNKFFLTASPMVRAKRRLAQSGETADGSTIESVAREIEERDRIDTTRKTAPLRKADDALLIDSSDMTIGEVVNKIISCVK